MDEHDSKYISAGKYLPIHIELYDSTLLEILEREVNLQLRKTHAVTHLVRLDKDKWLVRLEYSAGRDCGLVPIPRDGLGKPRG